MTQQEFSLEDLGMERPRPEVQPWSQAFWDGAKQGKLLIQHCKECDANIFYPRKFCPHCWSAELDWIEASGKGEVFTFSTAYDMVEPKFMEDLPYTIAYVDLQEGVRMMSRIVDCEPDDVKIGMEVQVVWHKLDDEFFLPYFKPA